MLVCKHHLLLVSHSVRFCLISKHPVGFYEDIKVKGVCLHLFQGRVHDSTFNQQVSITSLHLAMDFSMCALCYSRHSQMHHYHCCVPFHNHNVVWFKSRLWFSHRSASLADLPPKTMDCVKVRPIWGTRDGIGTKPPTRPPPLGRLVGECRL